MFCSVLVEEDIPGVDAGVSLSDAQFTALWEILRRPAAVIKRVPRCFRHQCVAEITALLNALESAAVDAKSQTSLQCTCMHAMIRLFLFARTVLAAMPRGGQRGRAQTRNILTKRLHTFRSSNLASIIDALTAARPIRTAPHHVEVAEDSDQQLEQVRRRIRALVAAGNLSKAAKELVSTGLHQMSDAVQRKLEVLHPQAQLPVRRLDSPAAAPAQCEPPQVRAAILSFPTASAPGPSGLRADHLRDCITSVSTQAVTQFLSAITAVCNRCLAGELPDSCADLLLSARLLPFKKKDDGVRPIAVGKVLRRLVAKLAFKQVLP